MDGVELFEALLPTFLAAPADPAVAELREPIISCLRARQPIELRWRHGIGPDGAPAEEFAFGQLSPQALRSPVPNVKRANDGAHGWRGVGELTAVAPPVVVVIYPLPAKQTGPRVTHAQNEFTTKTAISMIEAVRLSSSPSRLPAQPATEAVFEDFGEQLFREHHGSEQVRDRRKPSAYLVGDARLLASAGVSSGASCVWIGEGIWWRGLEISIPSSPSATWAVQVKIWNHDTPWTPFARLVAAALGSSGLAASPPLVGDRSNLLF